MTVSREKIPDSLAIETGYRPLGNNGRVTLLEVELLTGRTHQIRAHLSSIEHPLLGDGKYGDREFNRQYTGEGVKYQLLHAYKLVIPQTGQTFTAPVPELFYHIITEEHLEEAYHENLERNMGYARMIILVVIVVTLINNIVLINAKIPSESMENTIMTGDRIFGYRLAYGLNIDLFGHEINKKFKDPQRFDIIIFKYPDDESQLFIKRIIGLPGEKVQIINGKVYINDSETPLDDSFVAEVPRGNFGPYEVPEDSYFVMGDNRNHSRDSRYWKTSNFVTYDEIVGKAVVRYYPSIKLLNNYKEKEQ